MFSFFQEERKEERGGVRLLDEIDEYVDGSFLPFPRVGIRIIVQRTTLACTRATWRKNPLHF